MMDIVRHEGAINFPARQIALFWFVCLLVVLTMGLAAPVYAVKKGNVELLWLGHAAFKISTQSGKVIMIDPFITHNPKTPEKLKDLKSLGKLDLILVTHAHGDHLGDAPELAKMHQAPVYAPAGLDDNLLALGILPKELTPRFNKGGVISPLGPKIKLIMTRAEHSSELRWVNPKTKKTEIHVGGEPAGFIIELENGFKIYHTGDTGLFADMKFIGQYYKPDLVLLPIGGHFTMDPKDAAYAIQHYLKPRIAIPIHYGTFPLLKGTAQAFIKALGKTETKVVVMKPGETQKF